MKKRIVDPSAGGAESSGARHSTRLPLALSGAATGALRGDDWPRGPGTSSWTAGVRTSFASARGMADRAVGDAGGAAHVSPAAPAGGPFVRGPRSSGRGPGIRLIENVQLVPPGGRRGQQREVVNSETDGDWMPVSRKRRRGRQKENQAGNSTREGVRPAMTSESDVGRRGRSGAGSRGPVGGPRKSRTRPRLSVVTITASSAGASYAKILRHARENVSLTEIGINNTRIRSAANGGIIVEVLGPDGPRLAGLLRSRLEAVLSDKARVQNTIEMGELRIRGLDHSTTITEMLAELARLGECDVTYLKAGGIQRMRDGLGVVWVQCPTNVALGIAELGSLTLGWTRARVDLMYKRPTQCYKCWSFGHVRATYRSPVDMTESCFRCGRYGHSANSCEAPFNCVICAGLDGADAAHRLGSPQCLRNQGFRVGARPPLLNARNFPALNLGRRAEQHGHNSHSAG